MSKEERQEKKQRNYLSVAFGALIFVFIIKLFWPWAIPFRLFEFFHFNGSLTEVISSSYGIFLWAFAINLLLTLIRGPHEEPGLLFIGGGLMSLFAGIFEELAFRWAIFFDEIVAYQIANWILLGFAGHGILEWFFQTISGPLADHFTLGFLHPYLFSSLGWAVGAAILTSNGKFRDGHSYQGWFGWINAWFGGMFLFYIMFKYGIFAAMLVHFIYDVICFSTVVVVSVISSKPSRKVQFL